MSFRGDDQRRYGQIPPVQYPVANHAQDPARPPSFNDDDDSAFFDQNAARQQAYMPSAGRAGEDEMFLSGAAGSAGLQTGSNYGNPNSAMSGYQHQYQAQTPPTPSTYNPQVFARSQSTSLPYHPHPSPSRFSTIQSPTTATPSNYTPAAYNPAAYAGTPINTNLPQRFPTYHGQINYQQNYQQAYSSPTVPTLSTAYNQASSASYATSQTYGSQSITPTSTTASGYELSQHSPYAQSVSSAASSQSTPHDPSYQYSGNYHSPNGNSPTRTSYPGPQSQAPYPTYSHIPVGPHYSANDSYASYVTRTRSSSQTSPMPSPPVHSQTSPGLQRHPTNAPLPSRPLDDVPEHGWGSNGRGSDDDVFRDHVTQEDLMHDIEADLGMGGSPSRQRPRPINGGDMSDDDLDRLRRYNSTASTLNNRQDGSGVNRYASNASTVNRNNLPSAYDYDSDESDPEGAAGVIAMQQAAMDDRRFSTGGPYPYADQPIQPAHPAHPAQPALQPPAEGQSGGGDYSGGMDLGLFSGGYAGNLAYGNDVTSPPGSAHEDLRPLATPLAPRGSRDRLEGAQYPAFQDAEMDYGGTGGLQSPSQQRLSFDEGDERVSLHSRQSAQSGSASPVKEDYPDMFYHPGLSHRPLPALPPVPDSPSMLAPQAGSNAPYQHGYSLSADSAPLARDDDAYYAQLSHAQQVERSISLSSHSNTPPVQAPARSRTDAAEERRKLLKQQQMAAQQGMPYEGYDAGAVGAPSSMAAYDLITLPSGRKRKFVPSKLSAGDIRQCTEPWALSGIAEWIRSMAEGEPDLRRSLIEEGLVKLFCTKVPVMNVADAETLSTIVVDSMFAAGILLPEEEWVKFGPGSISGVLWQLTGSGCYAPKVHETEATGRCYSHHCTRTLKKANLDELMSEEIKKEDWVTFYKMSKESIDGRSKKEIERQNVLHEIVTSEEEYMNQLDVLRVLYKDQLRAWQPPIIVPNRLGKFIDEVFGKVEAVHQTNKNNLLAQLKYRQNEQGPWIVGFSDLFREWIRRARTVYIDYASQYPFASYKVRRESDRNVLFRQFLDHVRNHKRSQRLDWNSFLKAPITRLQRYTLLLGVVSKNMIQDSEEKSNLARAIEEIHNVTMECDAKVADMQKKVEMLELQSMLVLRPGFHSVLNLDHLGRELILQGDLQRMGSKGVRWVDTHALLFDHYFILAKAISSKERNDKKYDVSKEPIPMPLLFLESMNDDPISKQKGITAPLARAAGPSSTTQLNKVSSNTGPDGRPLLEHTPTSSSIVSTVAVTRLAPSTSNDAEGKILYPFKIKHLGHDVYTLYATTPQSRQEWCNKIIEAKTRHAKALHAQNAEPFRLRVLADSAFAHDTFSAMARSNGVAIQGTPLDRAIREMEGVYGPGRGPSPVCRAQVNCATAFTFCGKSIIAIGTDYGLYISEASNPRGWTRSVQVQRVSQIAVLEEFSACIVIADRSLISYPLDAVAPVSNFPAPAHDNPRRAPQRLAKDVSFFATARMKDRMLLFYKRKEGMHNTFKVLEPVFQKSTEKKSRLFGRRSTGSTECFRDFDEFYLPTECFSLNLFQTYIAVSTAKGFELLTLDKKHTMSIPDLRQPAIANIANRIRDQKPLGMFKLNDQEFLLTYEDCAVYVDKHGDVSRTLIMEYSGKQRKAKAATTYGQYLLLFNDDYVEVRNAENGRLRQIIAGRDVRCLDYGMRGPTGGTAHSLNPPGYSPDESQGMDSKGTVKICMSHPEQPGTQIVFEMLLNDGHLEK